MRQFGVTKEGEMKVYNVKVEVVDLVRASSPTDAILTLRAELSRKGFDPYIDPSDDQASAYESEDQDELTLTGAELIAEHGIKP